MASIDVHPCAFNDLAASPNWGEICEEYRAWASDGMPRPELQLDMYATLEAAGIMRAIGAWQDGELAGYLILLINRIPHYDRLVATTESLFVAAGKRSSGAGLAMIRLAERLAKEAGAAGLFVTAPMKGPLVRVLEGLGLVESNRVFFRSFA